MQCKALADERKAFKAHKCEPNKGSDDYADKLKAHEDKLKV